MIKSIMVDTSGQGNEHGKRQRRLATRSARGNVTRTRPRSDRPRTRRSLSDAMGDKARQVEQRRTMRRRP